MLNHLAAAAAPTAIDQLCEMKEIPRICLIGHSDYSIRLRSSEKNLSFGEVNNARKLYSTLKDHGFPVKEVLDIYELFGIDDMNSEQGELFLDMCQTNFTLGTAGVDFINDFDNELTQTFLYNIEKALSDHEKNVLLLLSWPGHALSVLSTGIQKRYPIIGKEDSYTHAKNLPNPFPIQSFSKEVSLLISESLLGAINLEYYGVPKHKFLLLPNLAPPEAETLHTRSEKDKLDYRDNYLKSLIQQSGKKVVYNKDSVVIGYPTRFVRRKNIDMLIWAVQELVKEHPNILLVLKGDIDSEFDANSLYSEKLHQLLKTANSQPWFLWDKDFTPYPEVLKVYSCFDICPFISGAELGSNTFVEIASLGVSCLLLNTSVNPYLYKGMAPFIGVGELCRGSWVYGQPILQELIDSLSELIVSKEKREKLGAQAKKLANHRFGKHQLLERIPFLAQAAWSLFHNDSKTATYKKRLLEKLEQDFDMYEASHEKNITTSQEASTKKSLNRSTQSGGQR